MRAQIMVLCAHPFAYLAKSNMTLPLSCYMTNISL